MSRYQDRQWYVLPAPRRMVWTVSENKIPIEVIAFAFDGDAMLYVTVHGTVVEACEVGVA